MTDWEPEKGVYVVQSSKQWQETRGWLDIGDRHYSFMSPEMQVYAGFTFRRQYVQALKGTFVKDAMDFDYNKHRHILEDAVVYPYEMTPEFSWMMVRSRINDLETDVAETILKQYYNSDATRRVHVSTTIINTTMEAVYLPAYIYTISSNNHNFRIFVNGVSGCIGGQKIYSSLSLGTVASIISGAAAGMIFPEPTVCTVCHESKDSKCKQHNFRSLCDEIVNLPPEIDS